MTSVKTNSTALLPHSWKKAKFTWEVNDVEQRAKLYNNALPFDEPTDERHFLQTYLGITFNQIFNSEYSTCEYHRLEGNSLTFTCDSLYDT